MSDVGPHPHIVRMPKVFQPQPECLWGKLDATLTATNTINGVTFSIWSDNWSEDTGKKIERVLPPPTMISGSLAANLLVRIRRRSDGRWYVDMARC